MVLIGAVTALVLGSPAAEKMPILWLSPEGKVLIDGKPAKGARATPGASTVETPFGLGLDLDGTKGGLLLPDSPRLALADSLTISTWIYLRGYVQAGPGAQVLFRGDDRNGLDPYSLSVHADGTIHLGITDANNGGDQVLAPIPLKKWVHVTASFDTARCEAKLWLDGKPIKTVETLHQPLIALAKDSAPGIGIGNVQNNRGPHNQPLNGILADLRLYDEALSPAEAGWRRVEKR